MSHPLRTRGLHIEMSRAGLRNMYRICGGFGGKFEELMLIRDDKDLSEFLSRYQVEKTEIIREW